LLGGDNAVPDWAPEELPVPGEEPVPAGLAAPVVPPVEAAGFDECPGKARLT
jgi:hypothetical protein